MSRPRLLDLFCGAGGAAMGYSRAGFDVVGVDNRPQPNYPFEFVQAGALDYLANFLDGMVSLSFSAIHASPPCQASSTLRHMWNAGDYVDLIGPTRELLQEAGLPYVIENVPGAALIEPATICGSSVGLKVRRHRLFETNWPLWVPPCAHGQQGQPVGVYGTGGGGQMTRGYKARDIEEAGEAMGIDWMTKAEIAQAIPPAYTELIGAQLMAHLKVMA